jgi:hypothetical protein
MSKSNAWVMVLLTAIGIAGAENVQPSYSPGEGSDALAAASGHRVYFAPSMRFDAQAGSLEVNFGIEETERVTLHAFDTQGKLLAVLLDGKLEAGFHNLSLFSNGLQGHQGHVIFKLRAGHSVLAETRARPR